MNKKKAKYAIFVQMFGNFYIKNIIYSILWQTILLVYNYLSSKP